MHVRSHRTRPATVAVVAEDRTTVIRQLAILLAAVAILLGLGACQFQTLQPYTPADGVNLDQSTAKLRNMTVLVTAEGEGVLSGTVTSDVDDRLTSVTGVALLPDNTPGSALQSAMTEPLDIPANDAVVVTVLDPIRLTGADLQPGLLATVTLTFEKAGEVELTVPVLDKNSPEYEDLQLGKKVVPT